MAKINVALAGVGNCASGFVQGLHYYKGCDREKDAVGLRNLFLCGYHPRDIEIVSAFDVDARKVGKDLSQAIFAHPNNTERFAHVPKLGICVQKGKVLDGVGDSLKDIIMVDPSLEVKVSQVLRANGAEILLNLLPSGAVKASHYYAEEALQAGCAFINITPTRIASEVGWGERFEKVGLPVVGDDLIDQVGATTLHRLLLRTLSTQGVHVSETYQLDVGGGTESLNTLGRAREEKRQIKTRIVESSLPYKASLVAGTTDYVDFLQNRRDSYLWIKGLYFGKTPMEIEMRLSTADGPNAGSVLLDIVRAVKMALEREEKGPLIGISAYAFKQPPKMLTLEEAADLYENFLHPTA